MKSLIMIPLRFFRKDSPFCEEAAVIARKTVSFSGKKG